LTNDFFCSIVDYRIEKFGLEKTFIEVLGPFLRDIGILWMTDTICPAQEHFISNLIRQKILSEINKISVLEATDSAPIYVLYLPELEFHEISMMMLHYMLRSRGNRTIYLGQSVPIDDLFQVYQRVGEANFISNLSSQPSPVLLDSYLQRLTELFRDSGCTFHFAGEILRNKKSPELGLFHFYPNLEAILR